MGLINNPDFGWLKEWTPAQTDQNPKGSPAPDDLDELLVWFGKSPRLSSRTQSDCRFWARSHAPGRARRRRFH